MLERIGIYGGSFDPVHVGHVRGAAYALRALNLHKLYIIPNCASPGKETLTATPQQRLAMLALAVDGIGGVEVSDLEIACGGVSYTDQTVETLRKRHPKAHLYLIMGQDMLLRIDTWKNHGYLFRETTLAVLCRGAGTAEEKAKSLRSQGARVRLLENPPVDISSTDLRRLLQFGCAGDYLPAGVGAYIAENQLYSSDCKNLSLEELTETVISLLNPNRVKHTIGCRDTAAELAKIWGADETDAARAGMLHDITKALPPQLQLHLCRSYGVALDDFSNNNPKTLHALTGSLVAQRVFGEKDAVVAAIASHTTGKANMNTLEKIIYVADYMEPNRDFPGVEALRQLAHTNLDEALQLGLEMTLGLLEEQGREISPGSREAIEYIKTVTGKGKIIC